jgi:hypothetical protein
MKKIKLDLAPAEKQKLKQNGLRVSLLIDYAVDEISAILDVDKQRALEIAALIAFQSIPSIGPKFAHDLMSIGIYAVDDLIGKDGAALLDELERKQGFWTDPCVEDQFRLAINYATHRGSNKNWWDFTAERKAYRANHGYPADRPAKAWHETPAYQTGIYEA